MPDFSTKSGKSRSNPAVALMVASGLLVGAPACVADQQFNRLSLPVPVDVDGQAIHCPLYLNLEMKDYNVPFDQFAAAPADKAQTMFVRRCRRSASGTRRLSPASGRPPIK